MSSADPFTETDFEMLAGHLSGYRIESFIASGGVGAVYQARQLSLDRNVALKVLPRALGKDPEFRESFQSEARAMARLNHPNLIAVYDYGEAEGLLYIIMEYVEGCSLFHSANGKAIDPGQAVDIILDISAGLAHAHKAGIVHRDVKPANVLLNKDAVPKLGDFGLARNIDHDGGLCMGTPGYIAPEVLANPNHADRRSDLFAIGVVLHELLTGKLPDDGCVPPSRLVKVDAAMDAIVAKATNPNPALRYPDLDAFMADLRKWRDRPMSAAGPRLAQPPPAGARLPASLSTRASNQRKSSVPWIKSALIVLLLAAIFFVWNQLGKSRSTTSPAPKTQDKQQTPEIVRSATGTPPAPSAAAPPAPSVAAPSIASDPFAEPAERPEDPRQNTDLATYPCGLWFNVTGRMNITTVSPDRTAFNTHGNKMTWTWTPRGEDAEWVLTWDNGYVDTFLVKPGQETITGVNNRGNKVTYRKIPPVEEIDPARFLGVWLDPRNDSQSWHIEPDGRARLVPGRAQNGNSGDADPAPFSWTRGPNGDQITLTRDGNRKDVHVVTFLAPRRMVRIDPMGAHSSLFQLPERTAETNQVAAGSPSPDTRQASETGGNDKPAADPQENNPDVWKQKALRDFPSLTVRDSELLRRFNLTKKDRESITPSFFKNPEWPYQLAFDSAVYLNFGDFSGRGYVDRSTAIHHNRFYRLFLKQCTWNEARLECLKMRGRLVTITDQATQDVVTRVAAGNDVWIGATEEKNEGVWVWTDGSTMSFNMIAPGEGNNWGKDEDYLAMARDGQWGDYPADSKLEGFVCEWWKADGGPERPRETIRPKTIRVAAVDGKLEGNAQMSHRHRTILNWFGPARVSWTAYNAVPGTYDVVVSYGSKGGGNYTVTIGETVLRATVEPTGGWRSYQDRNLGKISITRPEITLALHGDPGAAGALMDFLHLELRPSAP